MKINLLSLYTFGLICFPFFILAQNSTLSDRPVTQANSLQTEPVIDGNVLNDPVWQKVKPFGDLKQLQPNSGQMASEKTDTNRVMLLNDLFVQYREFDSAKAMAYANQAIELSQNTGFKKGESLLLLNSGI